MVPGVMGFRVVVVGEAGRVVELGVVDSSVVHASVVSVVLASLVGVGEEEVELGSDVVGVVEVAGDFGMVVSVRVGEGAVRVGSVVLRGWGEGSFVGVAGGSVGTGSGAGRFWSSPEVWRGDVGREGSRGFSLLPSSVVCASGAARMRSSESREPSSVLGSAVGSTASEVCFRVATALRSMVPSRESASRELLSKPSRSSARERESSRDVVRELGSSVAFWALEVPKMSR